MKILLVEDERPIAQAVVRLLNESGYQVDWQRNGKDGLQAAESNLYDLIILDILLPGMNGWDICKELRAKHINIQVLMLSAMDEPGDVVRGLDLGADDYICKPFDPGELLARVRARLRTGKENLGRHIQISDLELDRVEKVVSRAGKKISLTPSEFAVLERMAIDAGKAVPSDVLAREVGFAPDPLDDPVKYCIASLVYKVDGDRQEPLFHLSEDGYVLGQKHNTHIDRPSPQLVHSASGY